MNESCGSQDYCEFWAQRASPLRIMLQQDHISDHWNTLEIRGRVLLSLGDKQTWLVIHKWCVNKTVQVEADFFNFFKFFGWFLAMIELSAENQP